MKRIASIFILFLLLGCSKDRNCLRGTVIGKENCVNGSLIDVQKQDRIGSPLVFNGKKYKNVISVPGEYHGNIAFKIREYEHSKDESLFAPFEPCNSNIGPSNVPIYVIIKECNSEFNDLL